MRSQTMHSKVLTKKEQDLLENLMDVDSVSTAALKCSPPMTLKEAYNLLYVLRKKYQKCFAFVNKVNGYSRREGQVLLHKVLSNRMEKNESD